MFRKILEVVPTGESFKNGLLLLLVWLLSLFVTWGKAQDSMRKEVDDRISNVVSSAISSNERETSLEIQNLMGQINSLKADVHDLKSYIYDGMIDRSYGDETPLNRQRYKKP